MSVKAVRSSEVYPILSYAALFLMVIVVFYAKGWFYLTGDIRAVVSSVPDDTAYFYKIAWNVVQGKGLTFDGINPTNGFQPLWLYLLLPLAWSMREATPEAYFRAALVYQTLLTLAASGLIFYALRLVASLPAAVVAAALFLYTARYEFINGMETGALMLCLAGLLAYSLRYQAFVNHNPRVAFGFGVIAGLVLLARLDSIFLLGICYLWIAARIVAVWRRGQIVRPLVSDVIVSLVGLLLVSAPYFIYNKLAFGAYMPISGQLKNSFPYILQPEFGLARFRVTDLGAVGVAAVSCVWIGWLLRYKRDLPPMHRYFYAAVAVSAVATVMHYFNTALFMKWAVFHWHFAPYHFTYCLILTAISILLFQRLSSSRYATLMLGAVAFALLLAFRAAPKREILASLGLIKHSSHTNTLSWHALSYEAAIWARQNTSPDSIFAMKDAGIFGLFSQRAVINLDGLVNNAAYQEALRQKRLNQYLAEKGVQYLVQHAMWDEMERNKRVLSGKYDFIEMPYRSQRYGVWSDPVLLYHTDEVFRRVYYEPRLGIDTAFVIWRLRYASVSRGS